MLLICLISAFISGIYFKKIAIALNLSQMITEKQQKKLDEVAPESRVTPRHHTPNVTDRLIIYDYL